MANQPIYDLIPQNLEFHNFTDIQLTEIQSKVLGLGLKFRPSLKPQPVQRFTDHIKDFTRSVRLHYHYQGSERDRNVNPKLYVRSNWEPQREDFGLEDNLYLLKKELQQNLVRGKPHWKSNLSKT